MEGEREGVSKGEAREGQGEKGGAGRSMGHEVTLRQNQSHSQ